MLWRIEIKYKNEDYDGLAKLLTPELEQFNLANTKVETRKQFFIEAPELKNSDAEKLTQALLCDQIIEDYEITEAQLPVPAPEEAKTVIIRKKRAVMEPAKASVIRGAKNLGIELDNVSLAKKFVFFADLDDKILLNFAQKALANVTIEEILLSDEPVLTLKMDSEYTFKRIEVTNFLQMKASDLEDLNNKMKLALQVHELEKVQEYFAGIQRNPTDVELQTIAQTWSEHCKHKTMSANIEFTDENGNVEVINNLLKSTVMKVTDDLNKDWCLSVFKDNAGVIAFDDEFGVCFKVETHNHPSALEPYGGAGTGIGGVIRDIMGTGLGAKPIMNTDVFCFAPPDFPKDKIPEGVMNPNRIMKGVVAGVRDYGNRMGIPTSNGAIYFHDDYIGNPLVFAGSVGVIPRDKIEKAPLIGDKCVVIGGSTGRDGLGGATFSSVELTDESEVKSAEAVQIGNPIEEKKVLDVQLKIRDENLYTATTDCGAGGLSSACGEMGEEIGVKIELKDVPLKYQGLTPWEIWLSEAQERMVFSVPHKNLPRFLEICADEDVSATVIGEFTGDEKLTVMYDNNVVADMSMDFLHHQLPKLTRKAAWKKPEIHEDSIPKAEEYSGLLLKLLRLPTIASKESVIRMYDHEVQGGSVVKPLVGALMDGPGDAAVLKPLLDRDGAIVVSNGLNPEYCDDPYWMAAAAIDEAIRNSLCVGGKLDRFAILDNFSWGNCNNAEQLGMLVKASKGLYDAAMAYGTPFISGKDSLNNEYSDKGKRISIPPTLLISGLSVISDVNHIVTSDFKQEDSVILQIGETYPEFGGSQLYSMLGITSATQPIVRFEQALETFSFIEDIIAEGYVKSAHDCSEGGMAVAVAEMCIGGNIGCNLDIAEFKHLEASKYDENDLNTIVLFSESQSRFILEVDFSMLEVIMKKARDKNVVVHRLGRTKGEKMTVNFGNKVLMQTDVENLRHAWKTGFTI